MTGQYQTNLKRFQYVTINIRKELSGCAPAALIHSPDKKV